MSEAYTPLPKRRWTPGAPINLQKWISENKYKLQPPIGNAMVYGDGEFKVMVVGGPNSRTDFHVDIGEEWFYQVQGSMLLRLDVDGEFQDVHIHEGDLFLLPGGIPHSPQRFADTIGLVIERERHADEPHDRLRWYCANCNKLLYEESFHLQDLVQDFKPVIQRYSESDANRTCKHCGHVTPPPPSKKV
eukprot:TRINITY_DN13418_c0_g1_i2.p1 TRINITY_DN13418_c0_g1~~TRINITY_DN13418_c0_g1_i2.p1  ORF type:complete len:189 (-),score=36.50 TRINITY_DN13418_c0_g1_i2:136-702(-)